MRSVVVYASRYGNTRMIADAIAETLHARGAVDMFDMEHAPGTLPDSDLVCIGGPTERHALTPEMAGFFDRLVPGSLRGRAAVAFDTRMQWPRFLSGSAADDIAKRLHGAGARVVAASESFFVRTETKVGYELVEGELARATAWVNAVADAVSGAAVA